MLTSIRRHQDVNPENILRRQFKPPGLMESQVDPRVVQMCKEWSLEEGFLQFYEDHPFDDIEEILESFF